MKFILPFFFLLLTGKGMAQIVSDTLPSYSDSVMNTELTEVVITGSRIPETILRSPASIEQIKSREAMAMGAPNCFEALENLKGVQMLSPSLGFKVMNTRGFANTTNVRFAQLVDGIDNQAPHIGAPIGNALGANDIDIEKIEIVSGTASALYGMNAINGLVNIRTKNPFDYQGLSVQQVSGFNHAGKMDETGAKLWNQTQFRYANILRPKVAFKWNGSLTRGYDWVADNRTDLAATLNQSTGLTGNDNPAYDEVNGYGNESSNRRSLTLNGKNYVVARTGYREIEITDYRIQNFKTDAGIFLRPAKGQEISLMYKGALINNIYQRSNRFRLQEYFLHQYSLDYRSDFLEMRAYLTQENTGKSYNIRSLAENLDRAFKSDNQWFSDYANSFNNSLANGATIREAHQVARTSADQGRFVPGTAAYEEKKSALIQINNWDYGAALRVKSLLFHSEALVKWDKLFPAFFEKTGTQLLSGFDFRNYLIIPDGNYFINPEDSTKNLNYRKAGGFIQVNQGILKKTLHLSATLRADKADYFNWKFNPRFTLVYTPRERLNFRISYQSGYRFPSIFEGFSNVNSGGVKRVGGLRIMSDGIFENSYTKASIDSFQAQVNREVNTLGISQAQAIENNKELLKKNPYTYLQPEFVRSFEFGFRGFPLHPSIFLDADFFYNSYDNFIAQMEASIPQTQNPDSIPTCLFSKSLQDRYRLWTNSRSKISTFGASAGIQYRLNNIFLFKANLSWMKLNRTEEGDGLEDGFNSPEISTHATIIADKFWKKLGAGCTFRYQTRYDYVSFLVSGEVPAYWSLDAQVNYHIEAWGLKVKFGATNFLNRKYETMLGGASLGGLYYLSLVWPPE